MKSAPTKPDELNIYLVGLMGAGKTTIGKLLAKNLNKPFYDSDAQIEQRTGVKIPIIFEIEGEQGFRNRELTVIDELTKLNNIVLATGGGVVLNSENRQKLIDNGIVIYLRATLEDLWQRTRHDKNRPLLQIPDPKTKLKQLFEERDPLYRDIADIIIDTGKQSASNLVSLLENMLRELCKH